MLNNVRTTGYIKGGKKTLISQHQFTSGYFFCRVKAEVNSFFPDTGRLGSPVSEKNASVLGSMCFLQIQFDYGALSTSDSILAWSGLLGPSAELISK